MKGRQTMNKQRLTFLLDVMDSDTLVQLIYKDSSGYEVEIGICKVYEFVYKNHMNDHYSHYVERIEAIAKNEVIITVSK